MQVKTTAGTGSAALGVIGTGLAMALPDQRWIGVILITLGCIIFIFDIKVEGGRIRFGNPKGRHVNYWGPWILIVGGPLIGALWLYFSLPTTSDSTKTTAASVSLGGPSEREPPTFREVFNKDFPTFAGFGRDISLLNRKTGVSIVVPIRLLLDFDSRTKFLSVFLVRGTTSFETCTYFVNHIDEVFKEIQSVTMTSQDPGNTAIVSSNEFIFSNTIYFYMDEDLSLQELADLEKEFKSHKIVAQFRGLAYYTLRFNDPQLKINSNVK